MLVYFGVVAAVCVLFAGLAGLVIAALLILYVVGMALTRRSRRGAVGALMDDGDRDFERMRRERIERRRARDGR